MAMVGEACYLACYHLARSRNYEKIMFVYNVYFSSFGTLEVNFPKSKKTVCYFPGKTVKLLIEVGPNCSPQ